MKILFNEILNVHQMTTRGNFHQRTKDKEIEDIRILSDKLDQFLEQARQIDQNLLSLESYAQQESQTQKLKRRNLPRKSDSLYQSNEDFNTFQCGKKTSNSDQDLIVEIMDIVFQLKKQISDLSTRQNQMKTELDYIRARVC